MSTPQLDAAIERFIRATPLRRLVNPVRARQIIEFCAIGGTGAVLDVVVTLALLGESHYLVANGAGFLLAVSFNFIGNYVITFDRPDGRLSWQYVSYVVLHGATFAVRAAAVAVLVEAAGVPAAPASGIGIVVAAAVNYIGSERIFQSDGRVWFDAVEAINHLAHVCYTSRLRGLLRRLSIYGVAYRLYQTVLAGLYRSDERVIAAGPATGRVHTKRPPEIVSVMHTAEKEQAVIERFVDDLRPDDVVWDIGANLGIFSVLAADVAGQVHAFEPHAATAERATENLQLSGVDNRAAVSAIALGESDGTVSLAVERDEVGTQTPSTTADGTQLVPQRRGDSVAATTGQPTVLKIDVEGAEGAVLRGLGETLADVRLVYVETHDATFHEADSGVIRSELADHGFEIQRINSGDQAYYRGVRR